MKKGISLIVLVITIIVMIILAASVVITLSNTGVINKATQAVDASDESQVQDLATMIWMDAYLDPTKRANIEDVVKQELFNKGIKEDKWNIVVTSTGVSVTSTKNSVGLGTLITKDNYGDTVDYSVTVDGSTYKNWQIYYHNNEYVYLVSKDIIRNDSLNKGTKVSDLSTEEYEVYEKFLVGDFDKVTLEEVIYEAPMENCNAVAYLIKGFKSFANTSVYGSNVVGALGTPTLELLVAGWNAKNLSPELNITAEAQGYWINGGISESLSVNDGLYSIANAIYWLAAPSMCTSGCVYRIGNATIDDVDCSMVNGIRPVICLKASIPAKTGTGDYDFELVK